MLFKACLTWTARAGFKWRIEAENADKKRWFTPIHSTLYSVAQPLERGFINYYSIIQGWLK